MSVARFAGSVLASGLAVIGCVADDGADQLGSSEEGVYYGTTSPTYVPLSADQVRAIGSMTGGGPGGIFCSATLIAPKWVLTAKHCGVSTGDTFCVGTRSDQATCFAIARVVNHGSRDTTLLELRDDVTQRLPNVDPIPIIAQGLGSSWVGHSAEAAGYGQTENGSTGRRYFTAEPIVEVGGEYVSVDGQGRHGLCYGDSGGPLMTIASDGSVRVIGDLTGGDGSCVDVDNYTRIDVTRDWINGYTGGDGPGPGPGRTAHLVARHSGKCMDVASSGTANGTNVQQWTCNGTGAQRFDVEDLGSGRYRLVNTNSGKCVDVAGAGTGNGVNIQIWSCNGGDGQAFRLESASGGYQTLVNVNSNRCVDVKGAGTADGANIHQWRCHGRDNQQWQIVYE